jgi:ATP synthase F1 epsilon subunit
MSVADLTPEHPPGTLRTGNVAQELAHGQVNLHVSVVSPEEQIYDGEAHWVTLPGIDGQFGIWPQHVTMVAALASGPLRIGLPDRTVARFAVRGSFVSVASNVVTILVDAAMTKEEVDPAQAQADYEATVAELKHPADEREFEDLLDRRAWSQERLRLARA